MAGFKSTRHELHDIESIVILYVQMHQVKCQRPLVRGSAIITISTYLSVV